MPSCRLCKKEEEYQYIRSPYVYGGNKEHNFWQCKLCDAIYLYPIPSVEDEKRFYLNEFKGFMSARVGDHRDWSNADRHKQTNKDQVARRLPFLERYLKPNADLLEIGCSSGFMLDKFREMGVNCVGVEPSGEFSEYLRKSGYEIFDDIEKIRGKKFDVVTHFFVFEHMRNPFMFLQDTYNLLRDGGVMVCEIPCANDPLTNIYNIDAFERFYWSIAHHFYYTPKSLHFLLEKLGFKYELIPEQRYDLSNHITWMMDGKPGGQNRFNEFLGGELVKAYRQRAIETWNCDTVFLYVWK